MSTRTKTLAKSLHTVSVIANVARYLMQCDDVSVTVAIREALRTLGYSSASDPYGLADKARAILAAE